jgi:hypothetical protein
MIDRTDVARLYFRRAARTSPAYLGGLALATIGLFGQPCVAIRHRPATVPGRKPLGTQADPLAAVQQRPSLAASAPNASRPAQPVRDATEKL